MESLFINHYFFLAVSKRTIEYWLPATSIVSKLSPRVYSLPAKSSLYESEIGDLYVPSVLSLCIEILEDTPYCLRS